MDIYTKVENTVNSLIANAFDIDENDVDDIVVIQGLLDFAGTRLFAYKSIAYSLGLVSTDTAYNKNWLGDNWEGLVKDIDTNDDNYIEETKCLLEDAYTIYENGEYSCYGTADEMVEFFAENFCNAEGEFLEKYMDFIDNEKLADYWCRSDEFMGKMDGVYFQFERP